MESRGKRMVTIVQSQLKSYTTETGTNSHKDVDVSLDEANPDVQNMDDFTKCTAINGTNFTKTKNVQRHKPVNETYSIKDVNVNLDVADHVIQSTDSATKFTEMTTTSPTKKNNVNLSANNIMVKPIYNDINKDCLDNYIAVNSSVSDESSLNLLASSDERPANSKPEVYSSAINDNVKRSTKDDLMLSLNTHNNYCNDSVNDNLGNSSTTNKIIDEPLLNPHPIEHVTNCSQHSSSRVFEISSSNDPLMPITDPNNCNDSVEDCFVDCTPEDYCNTSNITTDMKCSTDNTSVSFDDPLYNVSILDSLTNNNEADCTDDNINIVVYSVDNGGSSLIDSNTIILQEDPNVIVEEISHVSEGANNNETDENTDIIIIEVNGDIDSTVQDNAEIADTVDENRFKRKRNRVADPSSWERNIRKKQRMSGESYTSVKGKKMQAKKFNLIEECKCRFKCASHISVQQQSNLFKEYWNLEDACRQKVFVSSLVEENPIARERKRKTEKTGKEKSKSRMYFLPVENKDRVRVCLKFFCNVFQISFQIINLALRRSSSSGVYSGKDGRKNRPAPNATSDEAVNHVKGHIDSFPRMESHYCRKDSKKLYLSPELNLSELYRLYVNDYCKNNNIQPVKEGVYRLIFHKYDPPLTTFVPKKDQCSKCNQYRDAKDKTRLEENYQTHYRRKNEAMEMKKKDMGCKEISQLTATFDLQAVLLLPFAGDAQIYYKRKLSVYNFTVFDSRGNGFCYLWDECNGMKGSSEIGTGLLSYIMQSLPLNVNHLITYSDTCGGQNRNQYVASAMLYAVNTSSSIEKVDMKFMESGHTYLEADSMHATIERARKHKKVYTTEEWALLIEMARKRPRPYKVKIQKYSDMMDLTSLGKQVMKNRSKDTEGNTINWLKIKWLRFEKGNHFEIKFKYELQIELPFKTMDVRMDSNITFSWDTVKLMPKYNEHIPVSKAKKNDLLYLLKAGVIPESYSHFINSIPSSNKSKDVAPYVVADEAEENEEEAYQPKPRKKSCELGKSATSSISTNRKLRKSATSSISTNTVEPVLKKSNKVKTKKEKN